MSLLHYLHAVVALDIDVWKLMPFINLSGSFIPELAEEGNNLSSFLETLRLSHC